MKQHLDIADPQSLSTTISTNYGHLEHKNYVRHNSGPDQTISHCGKVFKIGREYTHFISPSFQRRQRTRCKQNLEDVWTYCFSCSAPRTDDFPPSHNTEEALKASMEIVKHRGPDASGHWISHDSHVGKYAI